MSLPEQPDVADGGAIVISDGATGIPDDTQQFLLQTSFVVSDTSNVFHTSTIPRLTDPEGPWPRAEDEANELTSVYQRMLDSLALAHTEIEADQERFAWMLHNAQTAFPPDNDADTDVFLFRDGMELRLREFEEECRRLNAIWRRLQQKLDEAEAECELEAVKVAAADDPRAGVDPRLTDKLLEQRHIIRLQQAELEQMHFEKEVLMDEAARLREECEQQVHLDDAYGDDAFGAITFGTSASGMGAHTQEQSPVAAIGGPREVQLEEALQPEDSGMLDETVRANAVTEQVEEQPTERSASSSNRGQQAEQQGRRPSASNRRFRWGDFFEDG